MAAIGECHRAVHAMGTPRIAVSSSRPSAIRHTWTRSSIPHGRPRRSTSSETEIDNTGYGRDRADLVDGHQNRYPDGQEHQLGWERWESQARRGDPWGKVIQIERTTSSTCSVCTALSARPQEHLIPHCLIRRPANWQTPLIAPSRLADRPHPRDLDRQTA